jgi:prepilin signal peptidase PulO-like enzyme (type II secretory pathway)
VRQSRTLLALRLVSVPATVVVVLVGIWLTGAVITNDFALAMLLTVAWLALAGLIALAIAFRSRAFRWPVLGAYVVTAAVIGSYLSMSVFMDKVVNEQVAIAAPAAAGAQNAGQSAEASAEALNVLLGAGRFESVRHSAAGKAQAIELAEGGRVLTLTDFDVDNGPDLRVYLVAGPAMTEDEVDDFVDLGGLKGNRGNQQYEIPGDVQVNRYSTVVIWCRAFSVLFARAPLQA